MSLEKDQILTPEKKGVVVDKIMEEISSIDKAIKEGNLGKEVVNKLRQNKETLQNLLNSIFKKKGVVTPNETNNILTSLDDAKKSRLEKSYFKSTKTAIFVLIGFVVIGGVFVYMSKRQNK